MTSDRRRRVYQTKVSTTPSYRIDIIAFLATERRFIVARSVGGCVVGQLDGSHEAHDLKGGSPISRRRTSRFCSPRRDDVDVVRPPPDQDHTPIHQIRKRVGSVVRVASCCPPGTHETKRARSDLLDDRMNNTLVSGRNHRSASIAAARHFGVVDTIDHRDVAVAGNEDDRNIGSAGELPLQLEAAVSLESHIENEAAGNCSARP